MGEMGRNGRKWNVKVCSFNLKLGNAFSYHDVVLSFCSHGELERSTAGMRVAPRVELTTRREPRFLFISFPRTAAPLDVCDCISNITQNLKEGRDRASALPISRARRYPNVVPQRVLANSRLL